MLIRGLASFAVFAVLHLGLSQWVPPAWRLQMIEQSIVAPVAVTAQWLSPALPIRPMGTVLWEPNGGLHVVAQCDGAEVLCLLLAALVVAPVRWRTRALGVVLALPLVHVLNCLRLLSLFYAHHLGHSFFVLMHGVVTPAVMLLSIAACGRAWLRLAEPKRFGVVGWRRARPRQPAR